MESNRLLRHYQIDVVPPRSQLQPLTSRCHEIRPWVKDLFKPLVKAGWREENWVLMSISDEIFRRKLDPGRDIDHHIDFKRPPPLQNFVLFPCDTHPCICDPALIAT